MTSLIKILNYWANCHAPYGRIFPPLTYCISFFNLLCLIKLIFFQFPLKISVIHSVLRCFDPRTWLSMGSPSCSLAVVLFPDICKRVFDARPPVFPPATSISHSSFSLPSLPSPLSPFPIRLQSVLRRALVAIKNTGSRIVDFALRLHRCQVN